MAARGISSPVGLLGLVRKTIRVRGVTSRRISSIGNPKSARDGTATARPPTARTWMAYISKAGSTTIPSGRPGADSSGRKAATMADSSPSSSPLTSAIVDSSAPRYAAHSRSRSA